MQTVRKLKLTIIGDEETTKEKYKFIRDSQYAQYQALNIAMGHIMTAYLSNNKDFKSEGYKKALKELTNSNPMFKDIKFGKGIDTLSMVTQRVKSDMKSAIKNGLAKGERSCTNYKRTYPLMTRGRNLKFRYENGEYFIDWIGSKKDKIIFKVILNKNATEVMYILDRVIKDTQKFEEFKKNETDRKLREEYKSTIYTISESQLTFDKKNHLILNLTLDIPEKGHEEIEGERTLGVDLGIKYPVYMSVSDNPYNKMPIGSINDFLKVREQMQERRKRLQKDLANVRGGRGRKKKLQALNRLKDKEKNFVQTYSHALSKRIVEFAKKNDCKYINMEKLTKDGFPDAILRNWSYHKLQECVEYKAEREGIIVRYVNPAYTSQRCSRCGYVDKENRQTQEVFICKRCGFGDGSGFTYGKSKKKWVNADHNASINIANSKEFDIEDEEQF